MVTQDTGFSDFLPTGTGLFAFSVIDDAVEAIKAINADYATHSRTAADLAREYFDSDVVLVTPPGENLGSVKELMNHHILLRRRGVHSRIRAVSP